MNNSKQTRRNIYNSKPTLRKLTLVLSSAITIVVTSNASYAVPWKTEPKGLGSVSLEPVGSGMYNWVTMPRTAQLPQATIYKTDNIDKTQTNDWASSVVFNKYSEALYAHPVAYRATSEGFEISNPPLESSSDGDNMGERSVKRVHEGNVDLVIKPSTFSPADARADKISDWAYDIVMANGNNSMKATIAHGSPYSFYQFDGAQPQVILKRGTSMHVVGNTTGKTLLIKVRDNVENKNNYYGLYAAQGTSWNIAATQINVQLPSDKNYFTVALLPSANTDADALNYMAEYEEYAYNVITDTRVEWNFQAATSDVITTYTVTTDKKDQSKPNGTIFSLYPHQQRAFNGNTLPFQYQTIRGTMTTTAGNSFTTSRKYSGILPSMPPLKEQSSVDTLTQHLGDYYGYGVNLNPKFVQPGVDGSNSGWDTYWMGKNLGRLSNLLSIADTLDDNNSEVTEMTDTMLDELKGQLEYWFQADKYDSNGAVENNYFYYNENWGTLIGYPASYFSDSQLNDHHFHYGYFIYAAAQVALRDPQWAQQSNWGAMVNELINDIASSDRSESRYPFLRNFDPYEGHTWASGHANYAESTGYDLVGGNNSESSSESLNAWAAIIMWGEATANTELRDLGIYLYTTEVAAVNAYWFNIYGDLDADRQAVNYPNNDASRVWGGRYDHSTWWTEDPIQTHAINWLPITGASLYLGTDTDFVQSNYDAMMSAFAAWDGSSSQGATVKVEEQWQDLRAEYLAMADPQAALNIWKDSNEEIDPAVGIEFGESRAHTYHWIKTFDDYGAANLTITPVNHTMGAVFTKNGVNTYTAYNMTSAKLVVNFSDGKCIEVAAHSMGAGNGSGVTCTALGATPPTNVTSISASNITNTSYTLNWPAANDESGIAHYELIINGVVQLVNGLTYNGIGLPLSDYSVAIVAVNNTGVKSLVAASTDFQLLASNNNTLPTDVASISATNITETSFDLNWSAAIDKSGIAYYELTLNGETHQVNGLTYRGGGEPSSTHNAAVIAVDNEGQKSLIAATTSFKLNAKTSPISDYISENSNGDLIYTVTYPQAMSNAQLFVRKNNDGFYILASSMGAANDNGDGSFTYTFIHPASYYNSGDQVYVRFYSHNPQVGQVFSPGPGDNVWSEAYTVGSSTIEPTPPSNVTKLTAENISHNSYQLTWATASDEAGIAHYELTINGNVQIVNGNSYTGSGAPLSNHSVAIVAVDNTGVKSVTASTLSLQLLDQPEIPSSGYISKAPNGDVVYTTTYPQAMSQAQLFVRKNTDSFYILAAGMGQSVTNANGSVTYTFTHQASHYSTGDDIYVRFYSYNPQVGQVFSPGPGDNVWSAAFSY